MIPSENKSGRPLSAIQEQRLKMIKKKEDTLRTVITSAKENPKFIKLLIYSLNSLEGFVSPPNREIRLNATIIIRCKNTQHITLNYSGRSGRVAQNHNGKFDKRGHCDTEWKHNVEVDINLW